MILVAGTVTIVGGASAACLAAIICVPAMFLVWGAIRLLRVGATWTTVGAISGGAVGFAGWLPVSYHTCQLVLLELVDGTWADWLPRRILLILLGPVLATLIGQVGGAYGGLVLQRAGFSFCPRDLNERPGRVSFSIGQLFSLTLVLSLALTALRMVGLLNAAMLLALACWLGLQVALRRPAIWIAERVMRFLRRPKPRGYLIASGKPAESEGAVR
ncbi:hypothetical protein KOR34_31620 [Posidoniimonas corsicana]|uniref:Uncharacterized protein n=2 Tax=Posidoniimonas corsicana TaxID=1938618 RepID=A0A5C5VHT1_9BACT|nr:hypothetical protein KOR34_31620 [Posidoniimonas corsicana]